MPFSAQPDPLPVVDSGRHLDVECAIREHPARALAACARRRDDAPSTLTARTGARADELAEHALRHVLDPAGARTRRADDRLGPRLGALAAAAIAVRGCADGDAQGRARERFSERDLRHRGEIGAARLPPCRAAGTTEEALTEEGGEDVGEVAEVEVAGRIAAPAQPGEPVPVVQLAHPRVREHVVGLSQLAEAIGGVGSVRDVGVELPGQPPEGPLDLVLARLPGDPEDFVVVALRRRHA